jgi:hypothetical protein
MPTVKKYEESLLRSFVASFEKLDDMRRMDGVEPVSPELFVGDVDEYGRTRWRPVEVSTDRGSLGPIYSKLPAKFPHLYELLVLSYRWAEVDLRVFTLMANPPGPSLNRLLERDPHLWGFLLKRGFIQFGKGPGGDYDPVCFDFGSRKKKGRDFRIVKIDHEEILCYERLKVSKELAPSFEELVRATIKLAGLAVPAC